MNTTEQKIRAIANKRKKEMLSDQTTYLDGFGKEDFDTLGHDLEAKQVIVRLVLGATVEMPSRALSYVDSAARTALHFPGSQLQIVHANHLGNKVNGVDLATTSETAKMLAGHTLAHLQRFAELDGRVIHALDTPHDTDQYVEAVEHAFEHDLTLATKMRAKGAKHGGDAERYSAAHFAFQDTDQLELDPIFGEQASADVIVSVGCQQERNFYAARMGMRSALAPEVDTLQIFTNHQTPPYYLARGGEPLLGEPVDLSTIGDRAAQRDLTHFTITNQENNNE